MNKRPEFIAVGVLIALVTGAALLGQTDVANQNEIQPSPLIADIPDTPTPPNTPTTAPEADAGELSSPTPPPTFPASQATDPPPIGVAPGELLDRDITATAIPELGGFNPITYEVPHALKPTDHFYFLRALDSDKTNSGIITYLFGATGSTDELRIHHGIDIPNPTGTEIKAAGSGTIIWAQRGLKTDTEYIGCYANVVVIEHDVGFQGESLFTLYAHLYAILIEEGDHVAAGQPIGLTGSTGCSTGPHLHFEVRVGQNGYNYVRNPALWVSPYIDTGVIAGRIAFISGNPIYDAPVTVINVETGEIVYRMSTYAGPGALPDEVLQENFAIGDVPAGRYLVTSYFGSTTFSGEVEVIPGTVNWVEMERHTPGE